MGFADLFGLDDEEAAGGDGTISRLIICDPQTRKIKMRLFVRTLFVREVNEDARIVRTINLIEPVSVQGFDAHARSKNRKALKLVKFFHDTRSGADLLADASKVCVCVCVCVCVYGCGAERE